VLALLGYCQQQKDLRGSDTAMSQTHRAASGGEILVSALASQGVKHVFCVPGESYLAALDALHDSKIEVTVCRQEGGAAMMAEAVGKTTGRPGICFVTRGPGASNAAAGVHIAAQDSTPMILFIGQVARGMREREAFQEVDYKAFFGGTAKWVAEIDQVSRIPEFISRAFHVATSGRPGPVVLSLPEDVLVEVGDAALAAPWKQIDTHPGEQQLRQLRSLLDAAYRPVAVVGGSRWTREACEAFMAFAEREQIPVATSFRRQSLFNADHPCFAGEVGAGINPKLKALVQESDLLLLIGGRLSELPSAGYTMLEIPEPAQPLVHVYPGAEELGRVYRPTLGIHASPASFALALAGVEQASQRSGEWLDRARTAYLEWTEQPSANPGAVQIGALINWVRQNVSDDAILTVGAGNYAGWVQRFFRFRQFGTFVAPTSGSMGYGVPAAVAMQRLHPSRTVVAFAGDGCFLMHGQEFATAVQYRLPILVVVINNGMYGTIRMHQEREYPRRVVATELVNPNFADYARAFGGHGEVVERTEQFAAAFGRARASGKPSIIEVRIDPQAISTTSTLDEVRTNALKRQQSELSKATIG
jgi:acetolactate synthase-1/2/3 large subunit